MDLKRYRDHVRRLVSERTGESVYNGSADHAAIIVENIFAAAHQSVRVLSGDLNAMVYGAEPVVQRVKQFLGHSDHRLEIYLEHVTISPSHPLVEAITDDANVELFHIEKELSARLPFHFMTADNDCFRFEREKNSHAAVAAFGDEEAAANLNGLFDVIRKHSHKLDMSDLRA